MQNKVWYNSGVPKTFEKKSAQLGIKVSASTLATIEQIAVNEDRPVGYVARELMIRGLGLYRQDGRLRDDAQPTKGVMKVKDDLVLSSPKQARKAG